MIKAGSNAEVPFADMLHRKVEMLNVEEGNRRVDQQMARPDCQAVKMLECSTVEALPVPRNQFDHQTTEVPDVEGRR